MELCCRVGRKRINQKTVEQMHLGSADEKHRNNSLLYAISSFFAEQEERVCSFRRRMKETLKYLTMLERITSLEEDVYTAEEVDQVLQAIPRLKKYNISIFKLRKRKMRLLTQLLSDEDDEKQAPWCKIILHRGVYHKIKDFNTLTAAKYCPQCGLTFTRQDNLNTHLRLKCKKQEGNKIERKILHHSQIYRKRKYMVDLLNELGMHLPDDYQFIKHFATFDIESYCNKVPNNKGGVKEVQTLALICVATTVPGYECLYFYNKGNVNLCMARFVKKMIKIAELVADLNFQEHNHLFSHLIQMMLDAIDEEKDNYARKILGVAKRLSEHLHRFSIYGYNSATYDLGILTASGLFYWMHKYDEDIQISRDKNAQSYLSISSKYLRFVDVMKLMGQKVSLSNSLQNFNIKETDIFQLATQSELNEESILNCGGKLNFPFSQLTNWESINGNKEKFKTEDFITELSGSNLLSPKWEKYKKLERKGYTQQQIYEIMSIREAPIDPSAVCECLNTIFHRLDMDRAQFLGLYCAVDTISTLKLCKRLFEEFRKIEIYTVFESLTLSSMSFAYCMERKSRKSGHFDYFVNLDENTYNMISEAIVGGISTSFNRLYIQGLTKIQPHRYGDEALVANRCFLVDINSMYLTEVSRLSQALGYPMLRRREDNFKVQ